MTYKIIIITIILECVEFKKLQIIILHGVWPPILLVKNIVDNMEYSFKDFEQTFRFLKNLIYNSKALYQPKNFVN